jgi:hypothetical protein
MSIRTIDPAESRGGVLEAAIGFLTLGAFITSLVGVSSLFVLCAFYLRSHVTDLFLGHFFGA